MISRHSIYAFSVALALVSCGGQGEKKTAAMQRAAEVEHTLNVMPEYNNTDSVVVGSHVYVYTLHREADDSLKVVEDENGDRFADNFYTLRISRDGQQFFNHRFTKASFSAHLDEGFRQYGILDGFRFSQMEDGLLCFGACISYPESDMSSPFVVSVGQDGSYTISPDDVLDVLEEEENDGV